MLKNIFAVSVALVALASFDMARASCAADATLPQVKKSYATGQAHERAGKSAEALRAYLAAQAYICEPNPVEADAARRAAAVAQPMAQAAENKGDLESALSLYESGGLYADADRVMLAVLRSQADEPSAFDRAHSHFSYRAEPAFAKNNAVRIAATRAYQFDTKIQAELQAWATKACERVLQREAQAFNEQYLREKLALFQARPDDLTDFAALQALGAKQTDFARKWPEDLIRTSQSLLRTAFVWTVRISDPALQAQFVARVRDVAAKRAQTLVQKFFGAPEFLTAAIDYYLQHERQDQVVGVEARARQLGADAEKRGALLAAVDYFEVAGDDQRAQALQDRAQQQAQAKMQPSMEAMQRAAEEMRKQYSDPAKIEAMKKQAEEMQRAMRKQQAQGKSAEDLEAELGM